MIAVDVQVDVEVESDGWSALGDPGGLCRGAVEAALAAAPGRPEGDLSVAILLADDEGVRELNRVWRRQDKPTNVLSFPAPDLPAPPGRPRPLGDVALAFETVAAEAAAEGKRLGDHLAHLVVHGVLHLLGHDHLDDPEADRMEAVEAEALARLGIANPYRADA